MKREKKLFCDLFIRYNLDCGSAKISICRRNQGDDIEKTVVDIVFYREKIGIEETKEVLTTYLNRSDRNLNRLIRYAELLKCGDVMKKYLEVLV